MNPKRWTSEQFESMSWHDNHVHGLTLIEGEHGSGELLLDIDFIEEWIKDATQFRFKVVPATLRFMDVFDLSMELSYAAASAAMGPFMIYAIERESYSYPNGGPAYRWRIPITWPGGEISFTATGFDQIARGQTVESSAQGLTRIQRDGVTSL